MDIHLFNKLVAGLLFRKKMLRREQIQKAAAELPQGKDFGKFMVHLGLIDKDTYFKVRGFIGKMREKPNFEERAEEIVVWTARQGLFQSPEDQAGKKSIDTAPIEAVSDSGSAEEDQSMSTVQVDIAAMRESIAMAEDTVNEDEDTRSDSTDTQQLRTRPVDPSDYLQQSEDEEEADDLSPAEPAIEPEAPMSLDDATPPAEPQAPRAMPTDGKYEKIQKQPSHDEHRTTLPAEFRGQAGDGKPQIQIPQRLDQAESLDQMLLFARKAKASDIHISPGCPVNMRRFGQLKSVTKEPLTQAVIQQLFEGALTEAQMQAFYTAGDLELAYSIPGGGRYRLTLLEQRFGWDLTARVIPDHVRPFEESGLPEACRNLTKWATGMVLLTGPSGCGKSSTLATLVDLINQERRDHIITIENPVETVYQPANCQITQREIGSQTLSQSNALRAALRQDPDILVIGELRDLETIRLAVSAAETGHLVFATMNTANATRTINRLIDTFPPEEQDQIRSMISESLRGIISQQLLPLKDGSGMVPAYEILIITNAVGNMIRKQNTHQLNTVMVTGKADGHVLLDASLKQLLQKDLVEGEEAFYRASTPKDFAEYAPQALKDLADVKN